MRVVRNTLLRRAVEGTEFECLNDAFTGPTLIAFSNEHPGAAASSVQRVCQSEPKVEIKAGAFNGEFIPQHKLIVWPRCRLTKKQLRS